jgi:hypothetical protein
MKLEISRQIFDKKAQTWFHQNPSSGSRVTTRDMRTDGRTDKTNLIFAFRNFAKVPKYKIKQCLGLWVSSRDGQSQ